MSLSLRAGAQGVHARQQAKGRLGARRPPGPRSGDRSFVFGQRRRQGSHSSWACVKAVGSWLSECASGVAHLDLGGLGQCRVCCQCPQADHHTDLERPTSCDGITMSVADCFSSSLAGWHRADKTPAGGVLQRGRQPGTNTAHLLQASRPRHLLARGTIRAAISATNGQIARPTAPGLLIGHRVAVGHAGHRTAAPLRDVWASPMAKGPAGGCGGVEVICGGRYRLAHAGSPIRWGCWCSGSTECTWNAMSRATRMPTIQPWWGGGKQRQARPGAMPPRVARARYGRDAGQQRCPNDDRVLQV